MKSKPGYRGVEFAITKGDDEQWNWTFYPKKNNGIVQRGQVKGTREQAEGACKKAIDAWLADKNSN
jgi:hypothetical protein